MIPDDVLHYVNNQPFQQIQPVITGVAHHLIRGSLVRVRVLGSDLDMECLDQRFIPSTTVRKVKESLGVFKDCCLCIRTSGGDLVALPDNHLVRRYVGEDRSITFTLFLGSRLPAVPDLRFPNQDERIFSAIQEIFKALRNNRINQRIIRETLERVSEMIKLITDRNLKYKALEALAERVVFQLNIGTASERTRERIKQMHSPYPVDFIFLRVFLEKAKQYYMPGTKGEVKSLIDQIPQTFEADIYKLLCTKKCSSEQGLSSFEYCAMLVGSINTESTKITAVNRSFGNYLARNEKIQAEIMAKLAPDEHQRSLLLKGVAIKYLEEGQIAKALQLAKDISKDYFQEEILEKIIMGVKFKGHLDIINNYVESNLANESQELMQSSLLGKIQQKRVELNRNTSMFFVVTRVMGMVLNRFFGKIF